MIPIKNLINKIKWDSKEDPNDYELAYLDKDELVKIKFNDIKKIEDNFMLVGDNEIPLHRVKVVMKKGVIVWRRKF